MRRLLPWALLFLLSLLVRSLWVSDFPPLLTQDEASIAYNAWSIAETGLDEWGRSWPLVFTAFGDAKQPVYIYLTAGFIKLFGWSHSIVRWPSVLAGSIIVLQIAWLTRYISTDRRWVWLAGIISALSPWSLHLSRMALESNLALCLFLFGLIAFIPLFVNRSVSNRFLLMGSISLVLSTYTYVAYRLFVPLFLLGSLGWLVVNQRAQWKKLGLVSLVVLGLSAFGLIFAASSTRFNQVGLLRPEAVSAVQSELRDNCHLLTNQYGFPAVRYGCVLLWNKFTLPIVMTFRSWLTHASMDFLFVSGDEATYRNPLQAGAFPFFLAPFFLLGIWASIKQPKEKLWLILGWAVSLVPSALADKPQAIRLSPLLPFAVLLIITGVSWFSEQSSKRPRQYIWPALFVLVLVWWIVALPAIVTRTYAYSETWLAYGQQLGQLAWREQQSGATVLIEEAIPEAHIFIAFWNNIEPSQYQQFDKQPTQDELGFFRPTQLTDRIKFSKEQFDYQQIICDPNDLSDYLVMITRPESLTQFKPDSLIRSTNQVHTMAKVFTLDSIKSQSEEVRLYCQFVGN